MISSRHFSFVLVFVLTSNAVSNSVVIGRKSWPEAKNFDIWNSKLELVEDENVKNRKGKVFHLFPVPVDGECLSNDGRRTGTCLNAYECRLKGGIAQGECSMGFGVCCIFLASCDQTINNNITYLVSPNFPSSMAQNFTSCKYKLKIMDSSVSQIRIDFNHFSLGQPNRKTGICDGDIFNVSGGTPGSFLLCGQNSGQHVYYDVEVPKVRRRIRKQQSLFKSNGTKENSSIFDNGTVEITMNFSQRFSPIRFWEIRIAQIPFSQRAPANCLQYFTGHEGIVQTFNFADNGRHLANQNYRSCIRQEAKMCSIMYEPCDDQSFKIGPTKFLAQVQNNTTTEDLLPAETYQVSLITQTSSTFPDQSSTTNTTASSAQQDITTTNPALTDAEGSGEENSQIPIGASQRPVRGGFDILSLFRSAFSFRSLARSTRQFYTTCSDRITMPCIVEDFVGIGLGPLPGCEPVHCGNQFCVSGIKPCRVESTVTPFYLGVHFGNGVGKGSAEENIGACIRYTQMQCI